MRFRWVAYCLGARPDGGHFLDGEAFTADQSFAHAASQHRLKDMTKHVSVGFGGSATNGVKTRRSLQCIAAASTRISLVANSARP